MATPGPNRSPASGHYTVTTGRTGKTYHLPSIHLGVQGTNVMRLSRSLDNTVWEKGVYGAVYRANLAIAKECQRIAAELLKGSLVRPSQSTGRLEEAISDPDVVYADATKIIIGVGEVLDTKAVYWRAVEEGMDPLPFTAFGFWTTAGRGESGPLSGPSGDRNGRPIIMAFDSAPNAKRFFTWKFDRGIEPHLFFAKAWDEVRSNGYVEEAYRQAFLQTTGPNGRPLEFGSAFSSKFGRSAGAGDFG
jgi:hypothetical protein